MILPRLVDKVRLNAMKRLPDDYVKNLLGSSSTTLDGQLLEFMGLDGEELKKAILLTDSDEALLSWVESHALPHSMTEKQEWARQIESYRADPTRVAYRRRVYSDLALRVDVGKLSVFDLIDMDEGRMSVPY